MTTYETAQRWCSPWSYEEGDPHMVVGEPNSECPCYYIHDRVGNCIAIVPDDDYLGLSTVMGNIRLMTIAPLMYETLQAVLEWHAGYPHGNENFDALTSAEVYERVRTTLTAAEDKEDNMARYRKRPVIIEAQPFQLGMEDGATHACDIPNGVYVPNLVFWVDENNLRRYPYIDSMEGRQYIYNGDFIIIGGNGKRYLCRADDFHATYEPAF